MEKKFVITLKTRTEVFSVAELFKRHHIPYGIVSTPREAGSACGVSIEFSPSDYVVALSLLTKNGMNILSILVKEEQLFYGKKRYVFKSY